jgi:hypothetical protein
MPDFQPLNENFLQQQGWCCCSFSASGLPFQSGILPAQVRKQHHASRVAALKLERRLALACKDLAKLNVDSLNNGVSPVRIPTNA